MDWLVIVILIVVVGVYFRRFDKVVYAVAIIDIFLRVFKFLISNIQINGISEYVERYLPANIPAIISNYTSDILYNVLTWIYVICMTIFLFYNIKYFFTRKWVQ